MLGILDYKAGNQTSVRRALEHLGIPCFISDDPERLSAADGLIFPGVGQAGQAMEQLARRHLDVFLKDISGKKPILGICLGCQILLDFSEENDTPLLGILKGRVRRFPDTLVLEDGTRAPVPHMGWNTVKQIRPSPLFHGIPGGAAFYFVHSFYTEPDPDLVIATTSYGRTFCSAYGRDGLFAVQFHPEKSGRPGLTLLNNFHAFCRENSHAH